MTSATPASVVGQDGAVDTAVNSAVDSAVDRVAVDRAERARQLAFLSYLRIIAIIGVVGMHVCGLVVIDPDLEGTALWYASVTVNMGFQWRVSMLVMVSGALLLRPVDGEGLWAFYRRRLQRIGIPLTTWHLVYLAFVLALGAELSVGQIVSRLAAGQIYSALYFFWLVLGLYVLTPVLRAFLERATQREALVFAAIAMAGGLGYEMAGAFIAAQGGEGNGPYNIFSYFAPYVGYYLLGYLLRHVVVRGWWLVLALLGIVVLGAEKVWQFLYAGGWAWLDILSPLTYRGALTAALTVLVFVVAHSLVPGHSRLATPPYAGVARRIADLTLGVYASHLLVLDVLQQVFGLQGGPVGFGTLALLGCGTLAGAFAFTWVLSKIPFVRRTV